MENSWGSRVFSLKLQKPFSVVLYTQTHVTLNTHAHTLTKYNCWCQKVKGQQCHGEAGTEKRKWMDWQHSLVWTPVFLQAQPIDQKPHIVINVFNDHTSNIFLNYRNEGASFFLKWSSCLRGSTHCAFYSVTVTCLW